MQYLVSAVATFAAAHHLSEDPVHERNHGHTYQVTAVDEVRFDLNKRALGTPPEELRANLSMLLYELDGRDLNEQLVGAVPSLAGIATWLMERLLLKHPNLLTVEVEEVPGVRVTVRREVRRP